VITTFPITIDATALTQTQIELSPDTVTFSTTAPQELQLVPGDHTFQPSTISTVSFTVTEGGLVDFDPSLDGILSGRGSSTLTVKPSSATITAAPGITILALTGLVGGDIPLLTTRTNTIRLLPLAGSGLYSLQMNAVTQFDFNLDDFADFSFSSTFDSIAAGRGTPSVYLRQR
jgi:hypothetical protein